MSGFIKLNKFSLIKLYSITNFKQLTVLKPKIMKRLTLLLTLISLLSYLVKAQENGGPYVTDENTVLLMHFDGNATNSADVGNNGVAHGSGVSYESGVHGQALRLDNSTADKQSWIEVPFYDELNIGEEFSIECWFKINSWGENTGGTRSLFRKEGGDRSFDYETILYSENNALQVNIDCIDEEYPHGADAMTTNILELDKWYHLAMYFNFSHQHLYLLIRDENYREIYSSHGYSYTLPETSNGKLMIGFGGWNESYFDGSIDELRISNKYRKYRDDVVSNIEISTLKDSVAPLLVDNWSSTGMWPLNVYYPINEITGVKHPGTICGPTALIRLLHYWGHPRFPAGYFDFIQGDFYWYAYFDSTEYYFDQMPYSWLADAQEEEYSSAAKMAVQASAVTYYYHVGAGAAPFVKILKENYKFNPNLKIVYREEYSKDEWTKIFKNELSHGRPIIIEGTSQRFENGNWAGHYYVCDGFKENLFHTDYSLGNSVWVDIDNFEWGKYHAIVIYAEPDWQDKTLTFEYPKGSEYFQKQTQIEIKWTSSNINTVLLEYSTDAGKNWQTIAENVEASTGKYLWTIPDTVSEEYKVRISDTSDGNIYRRCNTFNVFNKQEIAFDYPQNNTYFQAGTKQPVYWDSEGIKAFKLEYSTGGNWNTLCDSVTSAESLQSFTMPNLTNNSVQLRATNLANNSLFFETEPFRIQQESLIGGVYQTDENTILLMHFEEDVSNEANNNVIPEEKSVEYKIFGENYDLHLGKAFRINNTEEADWHCLWAAHAEELNLGSNWTVETWVKYNEIGTDKTAYPIILNKGESFGIWLDRNEKGFGGYARFNDQSEASFFQNQKLEKGKWYHVAITGNASTRKVSFYVHDEHRKLIYENSRNFPTGHDGTLNHSENDLFIGGVDGGSNIQFDGWLDELRITKETVNYSEMVTNIAENQIPLRFTCYPNPLNQQSVISFSLNENQNVDLSIFDIQGRKICTLLNKNLNAGIHTVPVSNSLPSNGVYICKLTTSDKISTLKIILNSTK